jgi:hypothetical protein
MALRLSMRDSSRYPPLQAIALAALIYALLEVACHLYLPPSTMEAHFRQVRERMSAGPPAKVQLMGDSVAIDGILTSVMDPEGLAIRHDAIEGSGPVFSYLLLREEIAAGRVPSYLLMAQSPHTFSGIRYEILMGRFAYWSEMPELAWRAEERPEVIYGIFARLSYMLSYREQLREALFGDMAFFEEAAAPVKSEAERLSAYRALAESGRFVPKKLPDGISSTNVEEFLVAPRVDYYFRRLLDLAQENGVKVYWISLPVPQRVFDFREQLDYYPDLFRYLDPFVARGQMQYLQRDAVVYEDSQFDDLLHMNMAGAVQFSQHLQERWRAAGLGR